MIAVQLYNTNEQGIPSEWPKSVIEGVDELPDGYDLLMEGAVEYNAYLALHQAAFDAWLSGNPRVRGPKRKSVEKVVNGSSEMKDGFVQVFDEDVKESTTIFPSPRFDPQGYIYFGVQPGIGFTIKSTNNTDSGIVNWSRHIN